MDKNYQSAYRKTVEGNKLIGAIATNNTMDRDGDIIDPKGVDLENFAKNPVLLWSHDHGGLPIGKVTDIRKTDDGIEFDAEFSESNPFAKQVRDLFAEGVLNAFSVGFIPKERRNETITLSELVEISAVNIPANPQALLSRSYKSFKQTLHDMEKKDATVDEEVKPSGEEEPASKDYEAMMMEMMGMVSEIKDMLMELMPAADEEPDKDKKFSVEAVIEKPVDHKKVTLLNTLKKINQSNN